MKSQFKKFLESYQEEIKELKRDAKYAKDAYKHYFDTSKNDNNLILCNIDKILVKGLADKLSDKEEKFYKELQDSVVNVHATKIDFWAIYLIFKKKEHIQDWSAVEDQIYKCVTNKTSDLLILLISFFVI